MRAHDKLAGGTPAPAADPVLDGRLAGACCRLEAWWSPVISPSDWWSKRRDFPLGLLQPRDFPGVRGLGMKRSGAGLARCRTTAVRMRCASVARCWRCGWWFAVLMLISVHRLLFTAVF
ncbi:hypothetical protein BRADI_4g17331v3 [Brachypodium distachyon]|uniref:Uncharacterized protein n=1 Tax=Brachypodium distachyon TaxID=15368 RepID=A0A0Q3ELD0_BRADI|nr:hypothetical protein BRADI_4g17331v3 [Brachypodium distachyon]